MENKPPLQRISDKIASVFLPSILILAIATVIVWGYYGLFLDGLIAGLSLLVIACPCALGLAIPSVMLKASQIALKNGVLFLILRH
jgi:Cation transport ATPase